MALLVVNAQITLFMNRMIAANSKISIHPTTSNLSQTQIEMHRAHSQGPLASAIYVAAWSKRQCLIDGENIYALQRPSKQHPHGPLTFIGIKTPTSASWLLSPTAAFKFTWTNTFILPITCIAIVEGPREHATQQLQLRLNRTANTRTRRRVHHIIANATWCRTSSYVRGGEA